MSARIIMAVMNGVLAVGVAIFLSLAVFVSGGMSAVDYSIASIDLFSLFGTGLAFIAIICTIICVVRHQRNPSGARLAFLIACSIFLAFAGFFNSVMVLLESLFIPILVAAVIVLVLICEPWFLSTTTVHTQDHPAERKT